MECCGQHLMMLGTSACQQASNRNLQLRLLFCAGCLPTGQQQKLRRVTSDNDNEHCCT